MVPAVFSDFPSGPKMVRLVFSYFQSGLNMVHLLPLLVLRLLLLSTAAATAPDAHDVRKHHDIFVFLNYIL